MIDNKYPGKCTSCNKKLLAGEGFAYKNGNVWLKCCTSTACMHRLGQTPPGQQRRATATLSEDGVITMSYDRDAVVLIKSLPGARWKPENKTWTVSVADKDLPRLIEVANTIGMSVPDSLKARLDIGTPETREAARRAERTRTDGKGLFPFQKEGAKFLALHDDKALLADDMGLGKTVQALVAIPDNSPVIIICPSSVKYNWRDEINMWRPEFTTTICSGRDSFDVPGPNEIVIINYDILPNWLIAKDKDSPVIIPDEIRKALSEVTLICDEAHKVKNYKAKRSTKVKILSRLCKRTWLLTGTPLMNRPTDLYGVLEAGNMHPLGGWPKFVELFNGYKNQWGGYQFGEPKPEVPEKLKRIMLRRLKSEVLKDLPPKTYQRMVINGLDPELVKEMDAYLDGMSGGGILAVDDLDLPPFEEFSKIRAKLAKARIPEMLDLVENYEESETPLLVFSAHRAPIDELAKREGWKVITGDVKSEDRRAIVQEFQSGKLKGVGLTISAGGEGLTLTRASNVLFVDLDWTPALNTQAEDRICRIGQTSNSVLIIRMVSSHPLELHVHNLLEYKIRLAHEALERDLVFKPLKQYPSQELINETEEELKERINNAAQTADREYARFRIQGIAAREIAKSTQPEPELTPARKAMLVKALHYMVGRCDGAHEKDGVGFNKPDAVIAHWISNTGLDESDDLTYRVLERILSRYYRQLKGKFDQIWKPDI